MKSICLHYHRSVRAERRATESKYCCSLTSFLYLITSSVERGGRMVIGHTAARGVKGRDPDSSSRGPSWLNFSGRKALSLSRHPPHQQHFLYHNPVFHLGFFREQDEKSESTWTKLTDVCFSG